MASTLYHLPSIIQRKKTTTVWELLGVSSNRQYLQHSTGSEARKEMRVDREAAGRLGGKNWWRDKKEA